MEAVLGLASWSIQDSRRLLEIVSPQPVSPGVPRAAPEQARQATTGRRCALIVGVDRYDDDRLPHLSYASADADAIAGALRDFGGYDDGVIASVGVVVAADGWIIDESQTRQWYFRVCPVGGLLITLVGFCRRHGDLVPVTTVTAPHRHELSIRCTKAVWWRPGGGDRRADRRGRL